MLLVDDVIVSASRLGLTMISTGKLSSSSLESFSLPLLFSAPVSMALSWTTAAAALDDEPPSAAGTSACFDATDLAARFNPPCGFHFSISSRVFF